MGKSKADPFKILLNESLPDYQYANAMNFTLGNFNKPNRGANNTVPESIRTSGLDSKIIINAYNSNESIQY